MVKILINNVDIRRYEMKVYRELLATVFQDFKLFSLPLEENIACSEIDINSGKIKDSLELSGFTERCASLAEGVSTYLYKDYDENGVEVSGGEAQKIAIARALYKDSPIIILDEPTSALDPIAEYELFSNFNSLTKDKTAIFITHRLASCQFCEKIIVFQNGTIVQQGNHKGLLAEQNAPYYKLWNAQAQFYI